MNKRKIFTISISVLLLMLVIFINFSNVYALGRFDIDEVNKKAQGTTSGMGAANNAIERIWGTVVLVLQVAAVAAVIVAGIRYMFSSAEAKADIKKQTAGLCIGAILVFGATIVVNFIVNVTTEVLTGSINGRYSNYDGDRYNDWDDIVQKGIPDILNRNCKELYNINALDRWNKENGENWTYMN